MCVCLVSRVLCESIGKGVTSPLSGQQKCLVSLVLAWKRGCDLSVFVHTHTHTVLTHTHMTVWHTWQWHSTHTLTSHSLTGLVSLSVSHCYFLTGLFTHTHRHTHTYCLVTHGRDTQLYLSVNGLTEAHRVLSTVRSLLVAILIRSQRVVTQSTGPTSHRMNLMKVQGHLLWLSILWLHSIGTRFSVDWCQSSWQTHCTTFLKVFHDTHTHTSHTLRAFTTQHTWHLTYTLWQLWSCMLSPRLQSYSDIQWLSHIVARMHFFSGNFCPNNIWLCATLCLQTQFT